VKIVNGTLVTLDVRMYDAQGNLLEASNDPLIYLHGSNDIFPKIEEALVDQEPGFETILQLEPGDAFGDDDPALLHVVPRAAIGPNVQVGLKIEGVPGQPNDGRIYAVTELADTVAVLDGNHPLAGLALRFKIRVLKVEEATDEELEQAETPHAPDFLRSVARHDIHDHDDDHEH
jgi:FKBP-type peptidyl-prolyl cis-trans isomerase SlyD